MPPAESQSLPRKRNPLMMSLLWRLPAAAVILVYLQFISRVLWDFWWTDFAGPVIASAFILWWALEPTNKKRRAIAIGVAVLHILLQAMTFSGGPMLEPFAAYWIFRAAARRKAIWFGWLFSWSAFMSFVLITRTSVLYNFDTPQQAAQINRQEGVRVILTVKDVPWMTHNVRFFAEDCDGKHWLLGASHGPMLIRWHKQTRKAQMVLNGRSTDTLYLDCNTHLAWLGDYESHEIYAVDTRTMEVVWTSPPKLGRTATIIGVPRLRMVVMAEDWGVSAWRIDYTDIKNPTLFKYPLRDFTDPRYSDLTGYLYFGGDKLIKVDPRTGKVLRKVNHYGFPDPHIIMDNRRGSVWVSNSLTGQVHRFDQITLEWQGMIHTRLGARYIYYDEDYDALVTVNYLNGELTAYDPESGYPMTSVQIGRRGRVITVTNDGKALLIATRAGLVAVERRLWKR